MKNALKNSWLCCLVPFLSLSAQQPTAFEKVGSGDESVQNFFPGEHRARPVLGDYTNSGRMGLFSGGQDLGGSTGWYDDERWGDQGDGTFANPVLNGDYSDPDVIRVGNKYYMTCSEFHYIGMNILESDDMVNWKIIGRIFNSIDLPATPTWANTAAAHGHRPCATMTASSGCLSAHPTKVCSCRRPPTRPARGVRSIA